jgi:hypothetical protein
MATPSRLDLSAQDVQVLDSVFDRYELTKREMDCWLADSSCIADDLSLDEDIAQDTLDDLAFMGLISQLPDGCYVPTMRAGQYRKANLLVATM